MCDDDVETGERLVFIDGQCSVIYRREVRDYAEITAKPVDRMINFHLHFYHWFGADRFRDVPNYSFAETQAEIDHMGEFLIEIGIPSLSEHETRQKVVPTHLIAHEVIDVVTFEDRYVIYAESDNLMTIFLPDPKVLIAQDMLYNKCHLFCGHGNFNGWADGLKIMQVDISYDLVLPEHGST